MASIISAGTTSGTALNFSGDTSGNLQLTTQAGVNVITVPNVTGTLLVPTSVGTAGQLLQSNGASPPTFVAASGLGIGQTWQLVTRTAGTTYTNTTGKPIQITGYAGANANISLTIDGFAITFIYCPSQGVASAVVIPIGATYVFTDAVGSRANTYELR